MTKDVKPYIVGVTGGSASGKTFFVNSLKEKFKESDICLFSQDNYYKPKEQQGIDENGVENYDLPSSLDIRKMVMDLDALIKGESISIQEYTFNDESKEGNQLIVNSAPIILVEGFLVFYFQELSSYFDLKIFVDADEHVKLKRRIVRDNKERGYDLDDVLYRYSEHVAPTYDKYIKPFKSKSDIIIPNNNDFEKALGVIVEFLKIKL